MKLIRLIIMNEVGLHARPATLFINECCKFQSTIRARNIDQSSRWVNAKSILGLLSLGVEKGQEIELEITGVDEEQTAEGLQILVNSDF
jgi:phosphotransferase system HPr (HPr) family protein